MIQAIVLPKNSAAIIVVLTILPGLYQSPVKNTGTKMMIIPITRLAHNFLFNNIPPIYLQILEYHKNNNCKHLE